MDAAALCSLHQPHHLSWAPAVPIRLDNVPRAAERRRHRHALHLARGPSAELVGGRPPLLAGARPPPSVSAFEPIKPSAYTDTRAPTASAVRASFPVRAGHRTSSRMNATRKSSCGSRRSRGTAPRTSTGRLQSQRTSCPSARPSARPSRSSRSRASTSNRSCRRCAIRPCELLLPGPSARRPAARRQPGVWFGPSEKPWGLRAHAHCP